MLVLLVCSLSSLALAGPIVSLTSLEAGDLLVTEVMANPSLVTDARGEWFEITNTSDYDVELYGLLVSDGTHQFRVRTSVVVAMDEAVVFGVNSNSLVNGGVAIDYHYPSSFTLLNTAADSITLSWLGTTFDTVTWDSALSGASWSLDAVRYRDDLNDDMTLACVPTDLYNAIDQGTPGSVNGSCIDPLVYFPFSDDFTTSGIIEDLSGNGYDAEVLSGSPAWSGGALYLDGGSSAYIPQNPLGQPSEMSVSLWFSTANTCDNIKLMDNADWNGGLNASGWIVGSHYNEIWGEYAAVSAWDQASCTPTDLGWCDDMVSGTWNHVAFTYDAAALSFKWYLNGAVFTECTSSGIPLGDGVGTITLGAWPSFGFNLDGYEDEVYLFDRAITADEMEYLYLLGP